MIKLSALLLAALSVNAADPNIDRIFNRLYDFHFAESQSLAAAYIETHPDDPMGYASLAASFTFSEMNRLQIFDKDMFTEEKQSGNGAARAGAEAKRAFEDALNRAKNSGSEALKKNSTDTNALLALLIAAGAERDFAALIEKRYKDSFYAAKASQAYALRLQAVDPDMADPWFTRGFSEYLVGSMPAVVRWLMKIEMVDGNKQRGVDYMEKCAQNGRYLKPFAQMMLATVYRKEKRFVDSRRMMQAFSSEHPLNQTVRNELAKPPKS